MPTTAAPIRAEAVAIRSQGAGLTSRQRMLGQARLVQKVDDGQHHDERRQYFDETRQAIWPDRHAVLSVQLVLIHSQPPQLTVAEAQALRRDGGHGRDGRPALITVRALACCGALLN
jgi:hypothetical protein